MCSSAIALSLSVLMAVPVAAQRAPRLELLDTAVLRSPRLLESSGAAPSHRVRGVVWTHNDSGHEPRLYATDSAGDDLGSILVAGAENVDWEDLGSGPCPDHRSWCLYPADIGDNQHNRDHIVVYRLTEPEPPRDRTDTARRVPLESATALRYPDRPHNAEALAVDLSGRIFIITKELSKPPLVFLAPRRDAEQRPGDVDTLRLLGTLALAPSFSRLRMVTGAGVSPDGTVLVVRTYSSLHFFRLRADSLPTPITSPMGLTIPVVEPQGEGVAFLGPALLVLTTEQGHADHAIVSRVRILDLSSRP